MAQGLLQLLECHICSEIFNEADRKPKVLPCQHTFCLACMKKLGHHEFRQNSGIGPVVLRLVLKCPECSIEYDVPDNDVENFPNNITMIGFLGVTPQNEINSKLQSRTPDDIKECLEERVERLRDKIAEAKVTYAMKLSTWEKEVEDAKKTIRSHCTQFKQAIDHRETALITKLDDFSSRRCVAYQSANAEFNVRLMEMTDFCSQMEQELKGASDRKVTRNLDRCLEMLEKLESGGNDGTCNEAATNGVKWKAKFLPDRKDTVHASIAMYGQLNFMEPKKPARKAGRPLSRSPKCVYTRDFLLNIQPHCRRKPAVLGQFPEISSPFMDVSHVLDMNKMMLEKKPMILNLLNDQRQSIRVTTTHKGTTGRASNTDDADDDGDWSPPRLYVGNDDFRASPNPFISWSPYISD